MSAGDVQTFHADGKWWNRIEGQSDDPQGPYDTREQAVTDGRDTARNLKVEHIVHGLDGRIHERNSYGNDPRNIPG
jgi:Uncharacterized protein conserved in bacteria (DUF2188)